jgi:hypothetical protein
MMASRTRLEFSATRFTSPGSAAMAFYYDHREEIDQRTAEAEAFAEAERLKHHSLLQEKLNAMRDYV